MLNKEVSSTLFKVFGMTQPGIEPRSTGLLATTLPTRPLPCCGSKLTFWKNAWEKLTLNISKQKGNKVGTNVIIVENYKSVIGDTFYDDTNFVSQRNYCSLICNITTIVEIIDSWKLGKQTSSHFINTMITWLNVSWCFVCSAIGLYNKSCFVNSSWANILHPQ